MTDIINENPNSILEKFQSAYFAQMGRRMRIGSEEYTLSSVFTYVLAHYAGLINQSYKNQNVETASGEFLDNIGRRYGLTRVPEQFSNPWFEGYFIFTEDNEYYSAALERQNFMFDPNDVQIKIGDYVFSNFDIINIERVVANDKIIPFMCRWVCEKPGPLPYDSAQLRQLLSSATDLGGIIVFEPETREEPTFNLIELVQSTDIMDDEAFRKYIIDNKYMHNPGLAGSFESVAKASSPNIVDARVRVQGDDGFIPGNIDLYCKPHYYNSRVANAQISDLISDLDLVGVGSAINVANIRTVGQILHIHGAIPVDDKRAYNFYIAPEYNAPVNMPLYQMKFNAVLGYLNNTMKIGQTFVASNVVQVMKQDLSTLSTDLRIFGIIDEDSEEYIKFDRYCNLPIYGTAVASGYPVSVETGGAHDVGATEYIRLKSVNDDPINCNTATFRTLEGV